MEFLIHWGPETNRLEVTGKPRLAFILNLTYTVPSSLPPSCRRHEARTWFPFLALETC